VNPVTRARPVLFDEPTRRLSGDIATGARTGVRLAVLAPAGYGKSTLLDHLARECDRTGREAVRFRPGGTVPPGALVLVDDAHQLPAAGLAELVDLAEGEQAGLVVAARPWPRPAGLHEVLRALRGQIVLRPFDRAQVEAYLSATGRDGGQAAGALYERTGGVPGLVEWAAAGTTGDPAPAVPAGLRHELESADEHTQELLLAAEAGAGLDLDGLPKVLDLPAEQVGEAVQAARATGLFRGEGTLLPAGAAAVRAALPAERRQAVWERLAALYLDSGEPVLPLARRWLADDANAGPGGACARRLLRAAGEEALVTEPALAARLFDAAVAAGVPPLELGARRAEAAALAGDLDAALRLADQVVAAADAEGRADAARVAAAALACRGQLARSAGLYRWAGSGAARPLAAIGLLGTGRLAEAERLLTPESNTVDEPPTLAATAIDDVARAIVQTVTGAAPTALSMLFSAAETLEPVGHTMLLPDGPAALGTIVALHCGEHAVAEPVLERAIDGRTGGAALGIRHRLLHAWIAMVRGDNDLAAQRFAAAGTAVQQRDRLLAVALEVALARRASDLPRLRAAWAHARDIVLRHPVDLFTLLPLGEFDVAAARLGERDRLAPHLRQAWQLLHALGDPPLWAASLHWSGLHAAIIAEQHAEAGEHAAALSSAAAGEQGGGGHGRFAAVLAEAADCWLKLLRAEVDAGEVESAARRLRDMGMRWDAARLAGQAAIRTPDRKAMVALLEYARLLQAGGAGGTVEPRTTGDGPAHAQLSERETQVAELVVRGLTYRQVGERLFISAKTVEHHMARMRQRLGADNRSDLLAQLRSLLG
jgi:DNA-binding CsgD family transcriptional regulator